MADVQLFYRCSCEDTPFPHGYIGEGDSKMGPFFSIDEIRPVLALGVERQKFSQEVMDTILQNMQEEGIPEIGPTQEQFEEYERTFRQKVESFLASIGMRPDNAVYVHSEADMKKVAARIEEILS